MSDRLGRGVTSVSFFVQNLPVQDVLLGRVSISGDDSELSLEMLRCVMNFFFFLPGRTDYR